MRTAERAGAAARFPAPFATEAAPATHADEGGLVSRDAALALAVALLLPVALFVAGQGGTNRMVYPASALLLAGYLHLRRSPWYVGFCVWLFCAAPLVRRLTDFQAGWDPANPVLVAPYLACLFAGLSLLRYASRRAPPYLGPFATALACVGYGTALALLEGRVVSGLIDALRWSAGPLCAVHLMREHARHAATRRAVRNAFLVAGPAMALYGVAQFIEPAAWDREWMVNVLSVGFDSIGEPAPFQVRVFSTLNSPASLAAFLLAALLVCLGGPPAVSLVVLPCLALAFALTQYRAGWGGLAVAALLLVLGGDGALRLRVAAAGLGSALAAGFLTLLPEVERTIRQRFDTLLQLSEDVSGQERLGAYAAFFADTEGLVLGKGLAISGAARRLDGGAVVVIDAGVTEPFLAFGVFGGTAFVGAAALATWWACSGRSSADPDAPLHRAVAVGLFAQLPFGRVLMGEIGWCAWMFLGLALSGSLAARPRPAQ